MDKCRQQNARYQRMGNMTCSQSKQQCGYQNSTNCNRVCNNNDQYTLNCNNTMMDVNIENCPCMVPDPIAHMPLAMAYVPWQRFGDLYEECEAIYHGTLFCDLDLDFCGKRCE